MRVISGSYRGRKLKSLSGQNTRPTTDKVKESLFNMIGPYFSGGQVLDLYAGSGALAIEAVSRGMDQAFCVDHSYQAIQIIKENVALTKETQKFELLKLTAERAINQLAERKIHFDLVFLDPPYAEQKIVEQLLLLGKKNLLALDSRIICETDLSAALPGELPGYRLWRRKQYGRTEIVIYERNKINET